MYSLKKRAGKSLITRLKRWCIVSLDVISDTHLLMMKFKTQLVVTATALSLSIC